VATPRAIREFVMGTVTDGSGVIEANINNDAGIVPILERKVSREFQFVASGAGRINGLLHRYLLQSFDRRRCPPAIEYFELGRVQSHRQVEVSNRSRKPVSIFVRTGRLMLKVEIE